MNKINQHNQESVCPANRSVCGSVLSRIETDHIQPRSRLFFHSRECFVWFAWFVSIVIGAVAVAVTLFVSTSVPYTLYEATHDNLLTAFVNLLPLIWLVVFFLTAYLAIVNLRHTRRGYRYRTATLLGSSLFFSLMIGATLQVIGHGYSFDKALGEMISAYPSYDKQLHNLWQMPEDGRLIGVLMPQDVQFATTSEPRFVFQDMDYKIWDIDTSELSERDLTFLSAAGDQPVRLMGTTTNSSIFHVCGVFPWTTDQMLSREEMSKTRQDFIDTVRHHYQPSIIDATAVTAVTDESIAADGTQEKLETECSKIIPIRRAERWLGE